jgi:transposase, IS30 family
MVAGAEWAARSAWSDMAAVREVFFALFAECRNTAVVARQLGLNEATCRKWVWRAGLSSSGKRGPRPHPEREQYLLLRADGISRRDAAAAAGVHIRTAADWDGGLRKVGPNRYPVDYNSGMRMNADPAAPVSVALLQKQLDPRFLSLEERERIRDLVRGGLSLRQVATQLGRSPSTISREITRNHSAGNVYHPFAAHRKAAARRPRPKRSKLSTHPRLRAYVEGKLALRWSPEQISRSLVQQFPTDREMRVTHEPIYQALYLQGRGELRRELTTALRTGRARRRPRRTTRQPRFQNMVMISDRPAEAADRAVPGSWEGDLIIGANSGSAIGTLVERSTRFVMLVHLPNGRTADEVCDGLIRTMRRLPTHLKRSLTWDQGSEMATHQAFSMATGMDVYFCDPASPWQRGSNENTNGLLRQYFPKGTDLSVHTQADLDRVAHELNSRPRKTLDWATPAERLAKLLDK